MQTFDDSSCPFVLLICFHVVNKKITLNQFLDSEDASEREDQPAEAARYVRYRFSEDFLHLKRVSLMSFSALQYL